MSRKIKNCSERRANIMTYCEIAVVFRKNVKKIFRLNINLFSNTVALVERSCPEMDYGRNIETP